MPPVTNTVPAGRHSDACDGAAGTSRRAHRPVAQRDLVLLRVGQHVEQPSRIDVVVRGTVLGLLGSWSLVALAVGTNLLVYG